MANINSQALYCLSRPALFFALLISSLTIIFPKTSAAQQPLGPVTSHPISAPATPTPTPGISCQNYNASSFYCVHSQMPLLSQGDTSNGEILENGVWTAQYLNVPAKTIYATELYGQVVEVGVDPAHQLEVENAYNYSMTANQYATGFNSADYDRGLLEYVNEQLYGNQGDIIAWDPGWCGGVTSAMILRTYSLESGQSSTYLSNPNVNSFIYQTFNIVGTNIQLGNTLNNNIEAGFSNVASGHAAIYQSGSFFTTQAYFSELMPLQAIDVVQGAFSHLVSLYGYDGPYPVLYDPWGSVYTVSATGSTFQFLNYIDHGIEGGAIPIDDDGAASVTSVVQMSDYTNVQ